MIHHVLAIDYDGTLAHAGAVDDRTIDALKRLRDSGRKLVLVTGRRLESLLEAFPKLALFQCLVAENDESMLTLCRTSAAVANALPAVKEIADIRLHGQRGAGVTELIDRLIADDLREVSCRPDRGIE